MNEESKPSILLSLPPELWHHIMKAVRQCVGVTGYLEEDEEGYQNLLNAALAHRTLQPYAQEELIRMLSVESKEQLITLVKVLKGSSRLAEYAKRTEVIELLPRKNEGEEGLNELSTTLFEMCCNTKRLYFEYMAMRFSTIGRLTKLRNLAVFEATLYADKQTTPFSSLTSLLLCRISLVDGNGNGCDLDLRRSLFSPARFPVLHQITIDDARLELHPDRFHLLLPQLSDVEFADIPLSLVATQLPHCISLMQLHLAVDSTEHPTYLLPFFDSLRKLHLEEFGYWNWGITDGETCLDNVRRTMAIVGEMKTLKKLSLGIHKINTNTVTKKRWIAFKEDARNICEKEKIRIVRFDDHSSERDINELIWVD